MTRIGEIDQLQNITARCPVCRRGSQPVWYLKTGRYWWVTIVDCGRCRAVTTWRT